MLRVVGDTKNNVRRYRGLVGV
jgi:hypothetical protein